MAEGSTQPVRVLIAEDQTIVREGIVRLLEEFPDILVVGEAANGREAVQLARQLHPDVVLLDVRMPAVDGVEAAEVIHTEFPDTGIVMLTFFEDRDLFLAALRAGASGYLYKTVGKEELVRAIRAVAAGDAYFTPQAARHLVEQVRRDEPEAITTASGYAKLTNRELEVLCGIARGQSNCEIARALYLSPSTVQTHRSHLMAKLGASTTADLVRFAVRIGLVDP